MTINFYSKYPLHCKSIVLISIVLMQILIPSCKEKMSADKETTLEPSGLPGQALAVEHCGSCHAFTGPELLPSSIWKNDILPSMGHRLGIYQGERQPDSLFEQGIGGQIVRRTKIYPEDPSWIKGDWQGITLAPPIQGRNIGFKEEASCPAPIGITTEKLRGTRA